MYSEQDFQPANVHAKRPRLSGVAEPSLPQDSHARLSETADQDQDLYASSSDDEGAPQAGPSNAAKETAEGEEGPDEVGKDNQRAFVPIHGNYRGYYGKRRNGHDPYSGDERLALIPRDWIQDKRVLDIGCNAGAVTIEIAQTFGPLRVTGVDIDSELIRRAHRQSRIAWSAQEPLAHVKKAAKAEKSRSSFRRRSPSRSPEPVDAPEAAKPAPHHFPIALSRMYGFLPLPSDKYLRQYVKPTEQESKERSQRREGKRSRGSVMPKKVCLFPHNITFKKADWVNEEISTDKKGYDCILALSVAKWIHLNGGDEGLMEFFTRVFMSLHPDGRFILEPQPLESYQKAARLSDTLKDSYNNLKIKPDDFERILLKDIGFSSVEKISDENGKGFVRPLHVYRRAAGSWL